MVKKLNFLERTGKLLKGFKQKNGLITLMFYKRTDDSSVRWMQSNQQTVQVMVNSQGRK